MRFKPFHAILATLVVAGCGGSSVTSPLPSPVPIPAEAVKLAYEFAGTEGQSIKPEAPLLYHDGLLYGTTPLTWTQHPDECCGTVFSVKTDGSGFAMLHRFGTGSLGRADGAHPRAGLIWFDGRVWGTTSNGGRGCGLQGGCGVVFGVDPAGKNKIEYYQFKGGSDDGAYPYSRLLAYNGDLYGTTVNGGSNRCGTDGCGTIFRLRPSDGSEKIVWNFDGKHGAYPFSGLTRIGNRLYGTTANGGDACGGNGCGVVYSFDPADGTYHVVYRFHGNDGDLPKGEVAEVGPSNSPALVGTTVRGGHANAGVLYEISTQGQPISSVSLDGGAGGAYPYGALIVENGRAYGTTEGGANGCGTIGCGTVFSWSIGKEFDVLYRFGGGSDGQWPRAGLVLAGGNLFGTTRYGGKQCSVGCGAVFYLTP
ncbi:MAG TPA: choice-of-anchor tandem repeat GloVer-containing protein [Candidatus Tumulicola sp.]|nr:choice-of-anchor tandem repeat GloVer-containing protein [Candidatus Tumulicola sp.]